jgi:hypothetical protein
VLSVGALEQKLTFVAKMAFEHRTAFQQKTTFEHRLKNGTNARLWKLQLAKTLVGRYHRRTF